MEIYKPYESAINSGTADSHAAVPEFPLSDSDISDSPRGLMWPVLDALERTMAARMVSAATVGEPDGVEVWHRGTARPQLRRARRRRRASSTDSAAMQRALSMVAALTGVPLPTARPSGVALETPESENVTSTEAPQTTESPPPAPSPLPLQPQPDVWPRPIRDHQQQTSSNVSSVADGAADSQRGGVSVLPAPHAVTYGDISAEQGEQGAEMELDHMVDGVEMELDHTVDGVEMELDHTADGAVLWSSDSAGAAVSLLDQFPFEPGNILGDEESLGPEDIDLAFGGGFFSAQPDKKFPLQDIVIPDFYFVGEFDAKENLIDAGDAIEARSAKSDGVSEL
ncbi:hypothetical protein FJT64_021640 [Amphibalanus amphitrite]|uniref:Uncharacterized protein n=1 Tax=Amphibalanus amphitrite TaxID=1232801 RepID=A0A6A4WWY3_AMPAM|nr:hypothetical protein FJT64_021640 [Amphibalanus amphitrite]